MLHKCSWNIRGRIQEPPPFLWTPLLPRTPPPSQEPPSHLRTFFLPKNPLLTQEDPFHPLARAPFLSKRPLPIQEPPAYTTPLHTQAVPPQRTSCLPKDPVTAHAPLPECQDEAKQFIKVIFCSLTLLKNNWLYFWLWSHCLPFLTTLQLVKLCICPTLTCLLQSL